jgi:diacylglycerol kinase (ATP)
MRWLAITNPAAGRPAQVRRAVAALAGVSGLVHEVVETRGTGDATRLARESIDFDGIIAVGGDGTIGEVLNGMALDRQVLAVLPAGHGNCLARDLGVWGLTHALEALEHPRPLPLDLLETRFVLQDGSEERRWCASTLAAGYVTEVVMIGRSRLSWLGSSAYAAAAMLTVPETFVLRFDAAGEPQQRTGVVINNTEHLSNFRGLPGASVRDGLLDVMELDRGWPGQLLHNLSVLAGSPRFGPDSLRQSRSVSVTFQEPRTVMADGELLHGVQRLDVECRAGVVRCVAGTR